MSTYKACKEVCCKHRGRSQVQTPLAGLQAATALPLFLSAGLWGVATQSRGVCQVSQGIQQKRQHPADVLEAGAPLIQQGGCGLSACQGPCMVPQSHRYAALLFTCPSISGQREILQCLPAGSLSHCGKDVLRLPGATNTQLRCQLTWLPLHGSVSP